MRDGVEVLFGVEGNGVWCGGDECMCVCVCVGGGGVGGSKR